MNSMDDFEGIKRIRNINSLTISNLYDMLINYHKAIGSVKVSEDGNRIIADTEGKYYIDIYLSGNNIVLERKLEENSEDENHNLGTDLKSIDMSIADRMIEQIYDFLIDFINNNGNVSEFITGVKKVLFVKQIEGKFKDTYNVYDKENKLVYEMKDNLFTKEYTVKDSIQKREIVSVKYADIDNNRFCILKPPFTTIYLIKNNLKNKTTFTGTLNGKEIEIQADYSDNHYIIEFNNIVIGAIDSLDADKKDAYRIEINNFEYEYLVLAVSLIIDLYSEKIL